MNEAINDPSNAPVAKQHQSVVRTLLRSLLLLILLLIISIGGGLAIGFYYQNDVKTYVIGEISKQLNTQIIVDGNDINFSVIENFPYASIEFKNVKALEAVSREKKDTLFDAQLISLQFNLTDIYNKQYDIKKIALEDVHLLVRKDKYGNDNYHFWKPLKDNNQSGFSFSLEDISLKNIHLDYKNYKLKQAADIIINKSQLAGDFSTDRYELNCESNLYVNNIILNTTSYLNNKNVRLGAILNIDNTTNTITVNEGALGIESLLFDVTGNTSFANEIPDLNVDINGKNIDIQSLLSIIPLDYKEYIKDYESDGDFYFKTNIKGKWSTKNRPKIDTKFTIENATITQTSNDITLTNVQLNGIMTNGERTNLSTSSLKIHTFSAKINQGEINSQLTIENFEDPFIKATIKANIALEELQKFMPNDAIKQMKGKLKTDISLRGNWDELLTINHNNSHISGTLNIDDVSLQWSEQQLLLSNLNGDFNFDKKRLIVHQLKGNVLESDFELQGIFTNLLGYLFKKNEDINIEATLLSNNIDLNQLLANTSDSSINSDYALTFSEHIDCKLKSNIRHLTFRKFNATDLSGNIILRDKKLILDPISFNTMNGIISTKGTIDGTSTTTIDVNCFSELRNINVTQLFADFENFGQKNITDQHIKGELTASVRFQSTFSPNLKIDMNSIYSAIDMTMTNGELNNVEAMKSLSRFVELEELENVKFSTLTNQFEIKNKQLTFPKMHIKSSAFDVTVAGKHTFDNHIDYRIGLTLDKVLFKKAKQAKRENESFGQIEDDGLGRKKLFITMKGTVDDPIIKYDKKAAATNIKEKVKVEKQTMKQIFKEEFNLFKKDSTLQDKKTEPKPEFKINWEEDEKEEAAPPKKEIRRPIRPDDEEDY